MKACIWRPATLCVLILGAIIASPCWAQTEEGQPKFSGPQIGEPVPDCKQEVVFGPQAGKSPSLHDHIGDKPAVIVFVHEVTRPNIQVLRIISDYAKKRSSDGLASSMIFLTSDRGETKEWMNRARRALPQASLVGISPDGLEGPGAFGLNREMQITAIVANKKKVEANFAIVQPSPASDARKICHAIAKTLGDKKMPSDKELGIDAQRRGGRNAGNYENLMRPFIQKTNTDQQVVDQAKQIEKAAAKDAALRKRIHEVTNRIINAGKLENYGTKKAQEYLKKWSKQFEPETMKTPSQPGVSGEDQPPTRLP